MASYLPITSPVTRSRPSSPQFATDLYDTESLSSDDAPSGRNTYTVPTHYRHLHHHHHHHVFAHATNTSSSLTAAHQTPTHSRPGSPSPRISGTGYFYSDDDQVYNPLVGRALSGSRGSTHRKWFSDLTPSPRRSSRRRTSRTRVHGCRRILQVIVGSPFFPAQPATILLSVTIVLIVGLSITLFLMYLLNPDKAPLPWRSYCAMEPPFVAADLVKYPPVGIFLGVMSTDTAVERRMLIRSTWAQHIRSRGSDGSTDRTVVRFILGTPQSDWTRRIQLEAESYKDIIVLPVPENMNNGKTHAYIDWAHKHALVPPPSSVHPHAHHSNHTMFSPYPEGNKPYTTATQREHFPSFAANQHGPAPPLAPHDPHPYRFAPSELAAQADWVRPEFVVKADDDAFVMLAELEARLRLEWYGAINGVTEPSRPAGGVVRFETADPLQSKSPLRLPQGSTSQVLKDGPRTSTITPYWPEEKYTAPRNMDPMIYWGYLVKARFMAGELYALSSSLVEYISTTPTIRQMTRGKEDKLVARWLRMHPRAPDVRWRSERCWIYDHPRAGTVYSHGFLFPSEVTRIRDEITKGLTPGQLHLLPSATTISGSIRSSEYVNAADADPSLTHSTVSRFGKHYRPPAANLTTEQEVESLIEGSALSKLRDETVGGATGEATAREVESAWRRRESRKARMGIMAASASAVGSVDDSGAVGGTIVVHFIKRNEWFLETALAFLEDEPSPSDDDDITWQNSIPPPDDGQSRGKSGGSRPETDLSGKNPIDLSNLDPQPEVQPAPKKGPSRIETDFSNRRPIDISHLDGANLGNEMEAPTTDPTDDAPVDSGHIEDGTIEPAGRPDHEDPPPNADDTPLILQHQTPDAEFERKPSQADEAQGDDSATDET